MGKLIFDVLDRKWPNSDEMGLGVVIFTVLLEVKECFSSAHLGLRDSFGECQDCIQSGQVIWLWTKIITSYGMV